MLIHYKKRNSSIISLEILESVAMFFFFTFDKRTVMYFGSKVKKINCQLKN